MSEIKENGIVYIIEGDYPNGKYLKRIKRAERVTAKKPQPTNQEIMDKLTEIETLIKGNDK